MLFFEVGDLDGLCRGLFGVLLFFEFVVFDLDDFVIVLVFFEFFFLVFIVISLWEFDFFVLFFEYGELEVCLGDLEWEWVVGML